MGLAFPQIVTVACLYLAFTYGSAPVAGSLLFSSVFFNLGINYFYDDDRAQYGKVVRPLVVSLTIYAAGLATLVVNRGAAAFAGATEPNLWLTIALGLAGGASLAWYIWNAAEESDDTAGRTAPVAVMTVLLAAPFAVASVLLGVSEENGGVSLGDGFWPLVWFGIFTFLGTDTFFRAGPISDQFRSGALAAEPLFVLLYAAVVPLFSNQMPDDPSARMLQVVACAAMAGGAISLALVAPRANRSNARATC